SGGHTHACASSSDRRPHCFALCGCGRTTTPTSASTPPRALSASSQHCTNRTSFGAMKCDEQTYRTIGRSARRPVTRQNSSRARLPRRAREGPERPDERRRPPLGPRAEARRVRVARVEVAEVVRREPQPLRDAAPSRALPHPAGAALAREAAEGQTAALLREL